MSDFLHKWITSEGVLIVGGILWAVVGAFIPGGSNIVVPAIPFPGAPAEFYVGPGHMIVLGLVPLAIKIFKPGTTPFQASPPPPAKDSE